MNDTRYAALAVACAWLAAAAPVLAAEPPRLLVDKGCIWREDGPGRRTQLTYYGKDRAPVLAPDGGSVAFLRKSTNRAALPADDGDEPSGEGALADQVWLLDLRTGAPRRLVADRASDDSGGDGCQGQIAHIGERSLCFSPDGTLLYFITSAWVVSGALHCVDLKSGREHFVVDANSVEVVASGEFRGHLIVQQHRYFLAGGSYDWFWLFTPGGEEVGPVGDSRELVEAFKAFSVALP